MASENIRHAYDNGLVDSKPNQCVICNDFTRSYICTNCRYEIKKLQKRDKNRKTTINEFKDVKILMLPEMELDILTRRINGETLQEVGDHYNFSRERARQILNGIKEGKRYLVEAGEKNLNPLPSSLRKTPFQNLAAEIFKNNISHNDLAGSLSISSISLYSRLRGTTDWTLAEAIKIKSILDTDLSIEDLLKKVKI